MILFGIGLFTTTLFVMKKIINAFANILKVIQIVGKRIAFLKNRKELTIAKFRTGVA